MPAGPVFAAGLAHEPENLRSRATRPPLTHRPLSEPRDPADIAKMTDTIRLQLQLGSSSSSSTPGYRTASTSTANDLPLHPPVPPFVRTDTTLSATDSDLGSINSLNSMGSMGSIGSAAELASHPSDASGELSSAPSEVELETPEPTESGMPDADIEVQVVRSDVSADNTGVDVGVQAALIGGTAVTEVTVAERPPLQKKADSDETIKPKGEVEGGSPPQESPPEDVGDVGDSPLLPISADSKRQMVDAGTSPMPSPPKTEGDAPPARSSASTRSRPSPPNSNNGSGTGTSTGTGTGIGVGGVGGRIGKPRLIARLSQLAARAQPLLTIGAGATTPGASSGYSGPGSSRGGSTRGDGSVAASPFTDVSGGSPFAERAGFGNLTGHGQAIQVVHQGPAPGMPPRLPSGLGATSTLPPPMEREEVSSEELEAAVEALARPRAPPPRVLKHRRSFPGAVDQGRLGFGQEGTNGRWL
jgi:hypothetical protein